MTALRTYSWRARDNAGNVETGTMSAGSAVEVGARLRAEGRAVVNIVEGAQNLGADELAAVRRRQAARRVSRDDVASFCEQMSVMLETGVPLGEALESFCRQTGRPEHRVVFDAMRLDIMNGETFSAAAEKWPGVFPRIMTSLLRASEASGTLGSMLGRIGSYLRKERMTVRQVRAALTYPAFMVLISMSLSVFLMTFVLPRFAAIYEGRHAALPGPTRVLLAVSEFLTGSWQWYAPALAVAVAGALVGRRRPFGRRIIDGIKLHAPIVGPMFRRLYVTRTARTMATLVNAGVNLLDIIDICRGVSGNGRFDAVWTRMEDDVRNGKPLADAFIECPYVMPNVASMIASGERSGRIGLVLERVSEFTEQELEASIKQVTAFIEPVMIIVMGAVVGGIAIALLLPIFRMGTVLAG